MAKNNNAFSYPISPNSIGKDESEGVHQTGPAWVLTFSRWKVRDTLRTNPSNGIDYSSVADSPLVVENDCISLNTADSKGVLTTSMEATLKITDVNYETELSPGDFVFVNILNWESEARRVANNARKLKPINGHNDGFKGLFKVQSVRKILFTDPNSGTKIYAVKITGFAFTEFDNSIYFNQYLIDKSDDNALLFASQLGIDWANLQTQKGLIKIQYIIRALIESFIGSGISDLGRKVERVAPVSTNVHFLMPQQVGILLGLPHVKAAKDIYNYIFGIQTYSSGNKQTLAAGMNPTGISENATENDRFMFIPNSDVEGVTVAKPEYWNQTKAWSILNQFTNSPLNEMYSCFRIAPNNKVMPTIVLRQIPFTTDNFEPGDFKVTKFMNVPRWRLSPSLVFGFDLGKDEIYRKNYIQFYGRSVNGPANFDISDEIAARNYLYDIDDVKRNGLRPYVVSSDFDRITKTNETVDFRAVGWSKILGDALIGGQLKLSGTINAVGIVEPIAIGDNLEFDNVVYHIEQISHSCSINAKGNKFFRTTILVSHGMDIENGRQVVYSEMAYGSAYDKRKNDHNTTNILPGVSESQDTYYRSQDPDTPISKNESFEEPNTNTSIKKYKR